MEGTTTQSPPSTTSTASHTHLLSHYYGINGDSPSEQDSPATIPDLKAKAIVGGANNQLARPEDDARLARRGILYCPDYLANAGGIINLHHQRSRWDPDAVERHVASLGETFREVIARSESEGRPTGEIADRIAEERFARRTKALEGAL